MKKKIIKEFTDRLNMHINDFIKCEDITRSEFEGYIRDCMGTLAEMLYGMFGYDLITQTVHDEIYDECMHLAARVINNRNECCFIEPVGREA